MPRSWAVTATDTLERCPECGSAALHRVRTDPPWCRDCEWNLGQWPEPKRKRGRQRVLRDRRRAFELNQRLMREFAGVLPTKPRPTRADDVLTAAAVLLLSFDLLLLAGGIYLLFAGNWVLKVVAVVLILVAIECRPRFGSIDDGDGIEVTREEAPQLWSVVYAAAQAVGAPRIDHLSVSNEFNASCGRVGLRGATTLVIGLPLWGALSPAGRQALLGHELGHLVNGDPTRGFWTQLTLTTFARLAQVFDPQGLDETAPAKYHARVDPRNAVSLTLAAVVQYVLFFPLHVFFSATQRALLRLAGEEHQRAEVYADAIGTHLGGTPGAVELADVWLSRGLVNRGLIRGAEESADPAVWNREVLASVEQSPAELRLAEQHSLRGQASRFASHPPDGLRSRLVSSWPFTPPIIPTPVHQMAAGDRELQRRYKSAQRAILNRAVF
jgi:heat shock protein HtpX